MTPFRRNPHFYSLLAAPHPFVTDIHSPQAVPTLCLRRQASVIPPLPGCPSFPYPGRIMTASRYAAHAPVGLSSYATLRKQGALDGSTACRCCRFHPVAGRHVLHAPKFFPSALPECVMPLCRRRTGLLVSPNPPRIVWPQFFRDCFSPKSSIIIPLQR